MGEEKQWECGVFRDSVKATLKEGTLTISGNGPIKNWDSVTPTPWYSERSFVKLVIEPGVTKIGDGAFNSCAGLQSVDISDSVTSVGMLAFSACTGLTSIRIPDSMTSIGEGMFLGCTHLTSVTIGSGVKTIDTGAFSECAGLASINIPSGVTRIEKSAFNCCTGLKSITIPGSVENIGIGVFDGCTSLMSITIGNGVKKIDHGAFCGCSSLTSVVIPNSVKELGNGVFKECVALASVTIGSSMASIGARAFLGCRRLMSITCSSPIPPAIGEDIFKDVDKSTVRLSVPHGSTAAYKAAVAWKEFKFGVAENSASHTGRPKAAERSRTAYKEQNWIFVIVFILLGVTAVVLALYILPKLKHDSEQNNSEVEKDSDYFVEPPKVEKNFDYFIDPRDGQKYRAVRIGNNTWMNRNLNYQPQMGSSWCYNNSSSNCLKYGRLYDWNTATTVCPSGWHLPNRQEWRDLAGAAGNDVAATALKTNANWIDYGNGTNTYDFSALPGGSRAIDGSFKNIGNRGLWWMVTEYDLDSAYYRRMGYNYDYVYEGTYGKGHGFSVRCVKDNNR